MRRIMVTLIALLALITVASGLYIKSVWNPDMPSVLVQRVQTRANAHGGYVQLSKIPLFLQQALIATEDRGFYHNHGIDIEGILRAMFVDLVQGRLVQGGSTITEQLVKDMFLTDRKTIPRKLKQIALAIMISRDLSKNQVLALYLNEVYLGHGAYGVGQAAKVYFNRSISNLTQAQCAILAGLPQAPSLYDPIHHLSLAKTRQWEVLKSMVSAGFITLKQAHQIDVAPLHFISTS